MGLANRSNLESDWLTKVRAQRRLCQSHIVIRTGSTWFWSLHCILRKVHRVVEAEVARLVVTEACGADSNSELGQSLRQQASLLNKVLGRTRVDVVAQVLNQFEGLLVVKLLFKSTVAPEQISAIRFSRLVLAIIASMLWTGLILGGVRVLAARLELHLFVLISLAWALLP